MPKNSLFIIFIFCSLLLSSSVLAGTLNVSDIGDAIVYQGSPIKNYGKTTFITVQGTTSFTDRSFLLFNITDIPASSTISAATLKLYAFKTNLITNPKYYLVYNTSVLNASSNGPWYEGSLNGINVVGAGIGLERNITWQTQPAVDTLQDNKSVNSTEGIWYSWDVTGAVQGAYASGNNISLMIKENTENNASGRYIQFYSKEFGSNGPILEITYAPNASDCSLSCGDCDCNSTQCFFPSTVGSFCDPDQYALLGYSTRVLTRFANCTGDTYYDCQEGTRCSQVSYSSNTTRLITDILDCSLCPLVNIPVGIINPHNVTFSPFCKYVSQAYIDACNCDQWFCDKYIYYGGESNTTFTVDRWTAGCWDNITQSYVNDSIIDSNGSVIKITDLTKEYCPECILTPPSNTTFPCPDNTTTICYRGTYPSCISYDCSAQPNSVTTWAAQINASFGSPYATEIIAFVLSGAASMFIFIKAKGKKAETFLVTFILFLAGFSLPGVEFFPLWIFLLLTIFTGVMIFFKAKGG